MVLARVEVESGEVKPVLRTNVLAVVPTYLAQPDDLGLVLACLETMRKTAPEISCLVVDDGSPAQALVDEVADACSRLEFELHRQEKNGGFARTVNVGLARARDEGSDAVLVNADIEFTTDDWLDRMQAQPTSNGDESASVVGGLLIYPSGLIQHAGVYFSLLRREFDHTFRFGPPELPEAGYARVCPVTAALQFIRHECLEEVGLYDEKFLMGWEDVDYCIRVFQSGRECVYQPWVRAIHHESVFRGRPSKKLEDWQARSYIYFKLKHAHTSFEQFVPSL